MTTPPAETTPSSPAPPVPPVPPGYPYVAPPQPAPKRGMPTWAIITLVIGGLVVLSCGALSFAALTDHRPAATAVASPPPTPTRSEYQPGAGTAPARPTGHDITYKVTGTGTADITYDNDASGGVAQDGKAALPWSKTFHTDALVLRVYVSAQRNLNDAGSITCSVLVDGVEQKTTTSNGPFVIATCSGMYRA